jgi:hypothetical protein
LPTTSSCASHEVSDLKHQPVAAWVGGVDQLAHLELAQDALRHLTGRLLQLDQGRRVEPREADAVGEAEERLHRGHVSVDRGRLDWRPILLGAHRLDRLQHVFHGCRAQAGAGGSQRAQEASPDTLVDANGVRRAVPVALEPDLEQIVVRPGIGVQRGQPIDLGAEHLGLRRHDDLQLGSGHSYSFR